VAVEKKITNERARGGTMKADANPAGSDRSILVVHGRDFKPVSGELAELVGTALRAGIERDFPDCLPIFESIPRRLAYYGDLTNELLQEQGRKYDPALDLGDRNNALNGLRGITARKRFGIRQYDRIPGKSAIPEFLADVGAPLAGALGLTMPLICTVSRDFYEYLSGKSGYAEAVRARLRDELCALLDAEQQVLMLSHGTGCAVAYDVLWQLSHDERFADRYSDRKVDTWVTLGAPLGDRFIRKRLLGAGKAEPSFPTNVISWHNVAAEDDYTCHDNTLADDFRKMMQERLVSAVNDFRIYNLTVRYGKSNPHSSVGYYIHPRVSKIVADWIQAKQVGASPNQAI
jgi:hypothetical protein